MPTHARARLHQDTRTHAHSPTPLSRTQIGITLVFLKSRKATAYLQWVRECQRQRVAARFHKVLHRNTAAKHHKTKP